MEMCVRVRRSLKQCLAIAHVANILEMQFISLEITKGVTKGHLWVEWQS